MDESSSGKKPLIALVLIAAVIGGAWYFLRGGRASEMYEAVDETVDVIVPSAASMQRRTAPIGEARALTATINARSQPQSQSAR